MRQTGIREARQNLSALIEDVQRGQEITITDRGRPVARLVPALPSSAKTFRGRKAFRQKMPHLRKRTVSQAVIDGREERT